MLVEYLRILEKRALILTILRLGFRHFTGSLIAGPSQDR